MAEFSASAESLNTQRHRQRQQSLEREITSLRQDLVSDAQNGVEDFMTLNYLGRRLLSMCEITGSSDALDEAISLHEKAISLVPLDHPFRFAFLGDLGHCFGFRYCEFGHSEADAESAIAILRQSISIAGDSPHPRDRALRAETFASLAHVLRIRFDTSQSREDLDEMIALFTQASECTSPDNPDYALYLTDIADGLRDRYQYFHGQLDDLQEAISILEKAMVHIEEKSKNRGRSLRILGDLLCHRFRRYGSREDLDSAISLLEKAVEVTPEHHPGRSYCLHFLGDTLLVRSEFFGEDRDLTEAIHKLEESLELRTVGHPARCVSLDSLGRAYQEKYEYARTDADLDQAIYFLREALGCLPAGGAYRAAVLNNLARALLYRSTDNLAHLQDINDAVAMHREAAAIYLELGDQYMYTEAKFKIARALTYRYRELSSEHGLEDLDEAIDLYTQFLQESEPNRQMTSTVYGPLGRALYVRFCDNHSRRLDDLNKAMDMLRLSLDTQPAVTPGLHNFEIALAKALHDFSHETVGCHDNYLEALNRILSIIASLPQGSPVRMESEFLLSHFYVCDMAETQFLNAMEIMGAALDDSTAFPRELIKFSKPAYLKAEKALTYVEDSSEKRLGLARNYERAVRLLPKIATLDLDIGARLTSLKAGEGLALAGAFHFTELGLIDTAVEILETGRGVFWSQALRLRSQFDDLDVVAPDLASTLRRISKDLNEGRNSGLADILSIEREAARRRDLGKEFESVLGRIRSNLPGFDRFLLGDSFQSLRGIASAGPVVLILPPGQILEDFGYCRAIILKDENSKPEEIPFLSLSQSIVQSMCTACSTQAGRRSRITNGRNAAFTIEAEVARLDLNDMDEDDDDESGMLQLLSQLWHDVVQPVFRKLALKKASGRARPRLWWCPMGGFAFLPLHAAGLYTPQGHAEDCCSDYVVSSYVPTLNALRNARARRFEPAQTETDSAKVFLTAIPVAQGFYPLMSVVKEMEEVKKCIPEQEQHLLPLPGGGTGIKMETAIDLLPQATVLHFCCHGVQDPNDPLQSGFVFPDGLLTISKLMDLKMSRAQFAFLSACETAMGDKTRPDQTIHIAAAMLHVGLSSVVGTMWSMGDVDGPQIAPEVYKGIISLPDHKGRWALDLDSVPYALDSAIQELRQRVSPARWATYIHVGA